MDAVRTGITGQTRKNGKHTNNSRFFRIFLLEAVTREVILHRDHRT